MSKKRTNLWLFFTLFIMITTFMSFLIFMYYRDKQLIIETKSGKLIGTTIYRFDKKVDCYFGVPYVEPPVGVLRFRSLKPKQPWKRTFFANYGLIAKHYFRDTIDVNFTKGKLISIVKDNLPDQFDTVINETINYALDDLTDQSDSVQVWNRFVQIVGDIIFVCSDFLFISQYSDSNQTVYYYRFKPKPKYTSWGPKWAVGAIHTEELAFVFGIPLILQKLFTLEEIKLSLKVVTFWTDFAKNGKPCYDCWPRFQNNDQFYMSLDVKRNYLNPGFPGFKFSEYYEVLMTETQNFFEKGNEIPA